MEDFKLLNGVTIPKIGFGTYKSVEGEDKETILRALRCGYRHLDTAAFYGNEEILGKSLRESGIPRDELFITSKIWRDDLGYDRARKSFEDSLQRLGTDYLDLCLIHWPKSGPGDEEWRKKDRGDLEGPGRTVSGGTGESHRSQQLFTPPSAEPDGVCLCGAYGGSAGVPSRVYTEGSC